MATDILLNNASFITTSGGTTTPASGTSETWHSSTLAAFAGIVSPNTECRVQDLAGASSEIILVTNVTGTSVTVTRGAEGTTPVGHVVGATFTAVITGGSIASYIAGNFAALVSACISRDLAQMGFWRGVADPGGTASEGDIWFGA